MNAPRILQDDARSIQYQVLSVPLISLSLFALNIFLSTPISNMCSVCLALNMTDQVSLPLKITSKLVVFYVSFFTGLSITRKDKKIPSLTF